VPIPGTLRNARFCDVSGDLGEASGLPAPGVGTAHWRCGLDIDRDRGEIDSHSHSPRFVLAAEVRMQRGRCR
jgi:hypothetical protein